MPESGKAPEGAAVRYSPLRLERFDGAEQPPVQCLVLAALEYAPGCAEPPVDSGGAQPHGPDRGRLRCCRAGLCRPLLRAECAVYPHRRRPCQRRKPPVDCHRLDPSPATPAKPSPPEKTRPPCTLPRPSCSSPAWKNNRSPYRSSKKGAGSGSFFFLGGN